MEIPARAQTGMLYAGFWRRVGASLIDSVILSWTPALLPLHIGAWTAFPFLLPVFSLGALAASWLYHTLLESSPWQATVGKKALNLVVTDMEGRRISWGIANARYWSKIVSALTLCVGYMMAGFTEKRQALHDLIAGTLVIRRERSLRR